MEIVYHFLLFDLLLLLVTFVLLIISYKTKIIQSLTWPGLALKAIFVFRVPGQCDSGSVSRSLPWVLNATQPQDSTGSALGRGPYCLPSGPAGGKSVRLDPGEVSPALKL